MKEPTTKAEKRICAASDRVRPGFTRKECRLQPFDGGGIVGINRTLVGTVGGHNWTIRLHCRGHRPIEMRRWGVFVLIPLHRELRLPFRCTHLMGRELHHRASA
ncbi:MAG: hypothetical protein E5V56_03290 [Mesorhizobium sp.]|nr:MAG: hypothetical protein E5V56_03290 [Mesorhizobium sp.]